MKKFLSQFGGKLTKELIAQYEKSNNWRDGSFQNLEVTDMNISLWKIPGVIYKQMKRAENKEPNKPIPIVPFDLQAFLAPSDTVKFLWYGHSAVLMRLKGITILIDPMLGPNTTPIAPLPTKRFSKNTLSLINDFPAIDLILLTHDHYDHLDFDSIQRLKHKTEKYFVALGVKRHLVQWGVDADRIIEFDWWDDTVFEQINVTFTPTRHFSGRGLTDRTKSLWGGWVFQTDNEKIWFGGDGGYGQHFKEIGERLGPFDFAFMECGQYNDDWPLIHLFPSEAVKAALDAGARKIMPVHWGGFSLSYHHNWFEPVEDFVKCAQKHKVQYVVPPLGKLFEIESEHIKEWWEVFKG